MLDLSISIVNYNSKDELTQCLDSLFKYTKDIKFKVRVIDNASEEPIKDLVGKYKEVEFIFNKKNIGFGSANNMAIKSAVSRYHLILNPDIIFIKNCMKEALHYLEANPEVGIIGPKMMYQDGSLQYSCRRFPTMLSFLIRGFRPGAKSAVLDKYLMKNTSHDKIMDVDWTLGSFMLARKDALDVAGGFDEKYFMYYEDIDLCYRLKKAGYRILYYPMAEVTHIYKRTSAGSIASKLKVIHTQSAFRFFVKYLFQRKWKTFI